MDRLNQPEGNLIGNEGKGRFQVTTGFPFCAAESRVAQVAQLIEKGRLEKQCLLLCETC